MNECLTTVYVSLVQQYEATVDTILENPEHRRLFLDQVRRSIGNLPEHQLLHSFVSLRKSGKLPRSREIRQKQSLSKST